MTCPPAAGGRPCLPVNTAWNGASAGRLRATTNFPGNGLPFRPSSTARPLTVPSAAATSGSARIGASTEAGRGCAAALPAPWSAPAGDTCRTSTSVPADACVNSASRLWVRLAVNTKLPHIRPVPRATASAVMASRTGGCAGLRTQCAASSVSFQGRVKGSHPIQHGLRRRPRQLSSDPPVGEEDDPVGVAGRCRVVGDHDDGLAELPHRPAQEAQHLGAGPRVQVAGGLVGEDDLGPAGQRPGDGDPLLLAARQLGGAVAAGGRPRPTVSMTVVDPCLVELAAGEGGGQGDVLRGGQRRTRLNDWKMNPTGPGGAGSARCRRGCSRSRPR